jgi:hypothetical protein
MRTAILVFLITLLCNIKSSAQAIWGSDSSAAVQDTRIIQPGHLFVSLVADNYDRDPMGIDIFDARVQWRFGLLKRLEFYGRYEISRAVSVPGTQPVPPSPLDIIFLPGVSKSPKAPYRSIYWPMPFLADSPAAISQLTPGEYALGFKVLLRHQLRYLPSTSLSLETHIPSTNSLNDLRKGSGSGSVDFAINTAVGWQVKRWRILGNLGYQLNNDAEGSDRLFTEGHWSEEEIERPDFLSFGLNTSIELSSRLRVYSEIQGWNTVGHHTPTFLGSHTLDYLVGLNIKVRFVSLNICLRQHLFPQSDNLDLSTGPLSGSLNLSQVSDSARLAYLENVGINPENIRPEASLLILNPPDNIEPPPGSSITMNSYRSSTRGNTGLVISLSFNF